MQPRLALDCRIDSGKPSSYTRVLELLRDGARAAKLPWVEWSGGPCPAPVLWSPTPELPPAPPGPLLVPTLHDVTPLVQRERAGLGAWRRRRSFRKRVALLAAGAARVVTVSETARESIAVALPELEARLRVVPNFPAPAFVPGPRDDPPLDLPAGGVLFVAALRRHKNWETLLRAWAALPADLRRAHPLVLAGDARRARGRPERLAARLGVAGELHLPGRVADAELPALYRSAALFVFPSLAEGFGLPPLEAMACGTPVLSSNATSLPEVLGEAAAYFEPRDVGALSALLRTTLESPSTRDELAARGLAQAARWSAGRTGAAMVAVLDELCSADLAPDAG